VCTSGEAVRRRSEEAKPRPHERLQPDQPTRPPLQPLTTQSRLRASGELDTTRTGASSSRIPTLTKRAAMRLPAVRAQLVDWGGSPACGHRRVQQQPENPRSCPRVIQSVHLLTAKRPIAHQRRCPSRERHFFAIDSAACVPIASACIDRIRSG
jgi:hypothetical protein